MAALSLSELETLPVDTASVAPDVDIVVTREGHVLKRTDSGWRFSELAVNFGFRESIPLSWFRGVSDICTIASDDATVAFTCRFAWLHDPSEKFRLTSRNAALIVEREGQLPEVVRPRNPRNSWEFSFQVDAHRINVKTGNWTTPTGYEFKVESSYQEA